MLNNNLHNTNKKFTKNLYLGLTSAKYMYIYIFNYIMYGKNNTMKIPPCPPSSGDNQDLRENNQDLIPHRGSGR